MFGVEFAEQKHFYACSGFLLIAVKTGGKYLGVVKYHQVAVVEKVDDVFEYAVLYRAVAAVYNHKATLVALFSGMLSYEIFGESEFEI